MRLSTHDRPTTAEVPIGFWSGVAGLTAMILFAISNFALGDWDPPPPSAGAAEISDFYTDNAAKLEWAVGMRFVVFMLLTVFLYGLSRHVRGDDTETRSLTNLALMGTVWLVATGTVANTVESILIYDHGGLAAQPELTRLSSLLTNALFGAAILPHALIIASLSIAGRRTGTLPGPLVVLGYFQAVTGFIGGVLLARTLEQGTVFYLTFGLSFFAFALWYLVAAVVLVAAPPRRATTDHEPTRASPSIA